MRFSEIYARSRPVISFELFPPKTKEGLIQLERRLPRLVDLEPSFLTVTYGALGSTRDRTLEVVRWLKQRYGKEVAHHLTCVGSTRGEIDELLQNLKETGVENIVALRGDPPAGENRFQAPEEGYGFAVDLVRHIRRVGDFGVAVAGYPEKHVEAPSFEADLRHLKEKVDAGADVVITQLFYDNAHYYRFVEQCRRIGVSIPIVPGLLPILNRAQILRITGICGSSIPEALDRRLKAAGDDAQRVHEIGIRHTVDQALELLSNGVPGIHFYVLNQAFHIAEIMGAIRPRLDTAVSRST